MMLGQRKPFDPNAPQYMPQVNLGAPDMTPFPAMQADNLPTMTKKPGVNWLGVLADALAGAAGHPGPYGAQMAREREQQTAFDRGEEQWQKHHQTDVADQMKLLDYKRAHPDDPITQALDLAGITDPAQRKQYYVNALDKKTEDDPIVTLTLPGDHIYSGPRSGLATALTGAAPASPLSDNVPTVTNSAGYDALPPGARFKSPDGHIRVKGGQTPPASGNFSR